MPTLIFLLFSCIFVARSAFVTDSYNFLTHDLLKRPFVFYKNNSKQQQQQQQLQHSKRIWHTANNCGHKRLKKKRGFNLLSSFRVWGALLLCISTNTDPSLK